MNVTLSWYVPPMGNAAYTLLVQKQAGTSPALELSILPALSNYTLHTTTELHVNAILDEDTFFSLNWARAFPQGLTRDRPYYGRTSQAGS